MAWLHGHAASDRRVHGNFGKRSVWGFVTQAISGYRDRVILNVSCALAGTGFCGKVRRINAIRRLCSYYSDPHLRSV